MFPLDPATGPEENPPAVAHGGTFVRPGAIAWGRAPGGPGGAPPDPACEVVEKALGAMAAGGHPNDLLDELARARVWLSVPGAGEGLVLSVTLEDPASTAAHAAVLGAIERAVASVPRQPGYPIDVTFPGESAPDVIDTWIEENTRPFYARARVLARASRCWRRPPCCPGSRHRPGSRPSGTAREARWRWSPPRCRRCPSSPCG